MQYKPEDIIDKRYEVIGTCSSSGGMGEVLYVKDLTQQNSNTLVLKYCREEGEDYVKRFRREVRLLGEFRGNSKVLEIIHQNTDHEPPYFVMPYYSHGDLTRQITNLQGNPALQENIFNMMIDCLSELHSKKILHRDIKPQNFLVHSHGIVISDFGLGMEPDSSTRLTTSSMFGGTQGYLPPEFFNGGFKHADESSDIYMLGKSFYSLLTGQDPTFLNPKNGIIHPALFHVIETACEPDKTRRYQSTPELKQALNMAFSVIVGRGGHLGEVNQLVSTINTQLERDGQFYPNQISQLLQKLPLIESSDQIRICLDFPRALVHVLCTPELSNKIDDFLKIYQPMVESEQYGWSFAETIADRMKIIFNAPGIPEKSKAKALELAIDAAHRMNRYAAMDTCIEMIISTTDELLGSHISSTLQRNPHFFIQNIEISRCKCTAIRNALIALKTPPGTLIQ